ncbi:hypothetical protein MNV49_005906 [Pseudohyphozyma bogoriensis]|nr:hypothetical protein MNV49_005906 [Pseudohyphozyma bogoriensis]
MSYSSGAWPALNPPLLNRLPQPPVHPSHPSLPPSIRYRVFHRPNLQDDADALQWEEDQLLHKHEDIRNYGSSWLVPLGRQQTQEEDAESQFSSSPRPGTPVDQTLDEAPSLNLAGDAPAADGAQGETGDAPEVDLDAEIEDRDSEEEEDEEEGEEEEDSAEDSDAMTEDEPSEPSEEASEEEEGDTGGSSAEERRT